MILTPQACAQEPVKTWVWTVLLRLSAYLLVLGAKLACGSCWTREVSMQTVRASPSLWFALYPISSVGVHASTAARATLRQHVPGWLETDGWQWGCGKLPGTGDLTTSENTSFHAKGLLLLLWPCCSQRSAACSFFSCSELSWATSTGFASFFVWFCSLGWKIGLNG